eukprot:scaffold137286_cov36-Cyclotella_meneghiniana.AAC.2
MNIGGILSSGAYFDWGKNRRDTAIATNPSWNYEKSYNYVTQSNSHLILEPILPNTSIGH